MEFTFNTAQTDTSVALNALKLYRDGNYKAAISNLLYILDVEPRNWDARLMVAVCYYKTDQWAASERAFRFLSNSCTDRETKTKAMEGLQAASAKLQRGSATIAEFGGYVDSNRATESTSWLDQT